MKKSMALFFGLCMVFMIGGQAYGTAYVVTPNLEVDAIINSEESGRIEAVFHKGGEDVTARGDSVIWGYFYADPDDVGWGSRDNPEVYVKIWFDISGRIDVNFFHVSVPDITVFSASPAVGTTIYDKHDTLTMDNRYVRHEYHLRRWSEFYTYDADGNMTREEYDRDGDGVIDLTRAYTFTKDGNTTIRKGEVDIDGDGITDYRPMETFTYDSDGNLLKHESGSYDADGNLLKHESSSSVRTYTYDDSGNKTEERYESDTFIRDTDGNVTRRLTDTRAYAYTYDDRGNEIKAQYETESFAYNADGNLTRHESDYSVHIYALTYDANGNITGKENVNGDDGTTDEVFTYTYNADGNMTKEVHEMHTELGTIYTAYAYIFDAGNMIRKDWLKKDGSIKSSLVFTYDAEGRVIKEEPVSSIMGKIYSNYTTYIYDEIGNLIRKVITGNLGGGIIGTSIPEDLPIGVYETSSLVTVVNIPLLPDSMKGYELYSWQADDQWHFTLITGTNRLKTYKEVFSDENTVSEDGWVKITVTGVDSLKAMLMRLPWKASVAWLNRELDGDQGEMPALSFPATETVDEIKIHCEQRGSVFVHTPAENTKSGFNIYLASEPLTDDDLETLDISQVELEPDPLLSDEDIIVYLQENHVIHLTEAGRQKLRDSPRVKDKEAFFVCVGDQPIYAGVFWSVIKSFPPNHSDFSISMTFDMLGMYHYPIAIRNEHAKDDLRADPRILTALETCGKLGTSSVDTNDSLILSDTPLSEWDHDPYTIKQFSTFQQPVYMEDDTLHFHVSYNGGFRKHEFNLMARNAFLESDPVQVDILLAHNANDDSGEVSLGKELTFEMSRLRAEYQRQYPDDTAGRIILRIQYPDTADGYLAVEYNFADRKPLMSDFAEEEGIEYYLQTDKARYERGEPVKIRYCVTNKTDALKELGRVPCGCKYEFYIMHNSEDVWNSCRVIPPCGFEEFTLNSGESKCYERVWEMTNDNGTLESDDDVPVASDGTYIVTGELKLYGESKRIPVNVSIEIREPVEFLHSERSRELSPDVTETELNELVAGNNLFAFDLYQAIRSNQDGNLFYSPYSISLALAMTYTGARDETAEQMKIACYFTLSPDRLHPAFNALDLELAKRGKNAEGQDGEGFRLNIANSIWGQKGYAFLPDFLDALSQNYGAGMQLLDFANAPEDSRIIINDWVSGKTGEKIKDLIPQDAISDMTRLVLTNAIYFNAAWDSQFEEKLTQDGIFYLADNTEINVPMMSQTEYLNYSEGEDYQAAEMMYDGREMSMVILLPHEGRFEEFESSLTSERLNEITDNLEGRYMTLKLPKFRYESDSVSLKETLSQMGMPVAFTWPGADFSGMDGDYDLYISDVFHKGFVSVNEAGTEAAAATAVIINDGSMPPSDIPELTVNRPFIFFIRDIHTNTVLFIGRIASPLSG